MKQTRRRPAEVRALLVAAATAEFAERGVQPVTTKDICERAGVSLSVMYRHFADKSELYREAMLAPLTDFGEQFAITWQAQRTEPWDAHRLMRSFVSTLHQTLVPRRDSLLALVAAAQHEEWDVVKELHESVAELFEQLATIGAAEAGHRGWFSTDGLDLAIRVIVGMILGYVAFEPFLKAGTEPEVQTERMLDEIAALVIWGLRRTPVQPS
jgi:AcrR family transcriptional regulator